MTRREQAEIDADHIIDWESFHDVFTQAFGFPDFYGRNMDAWIDCTHSIDCPQDGLTSVHAPENRTLTVLVRHARSFEERCPKVLHSMLVCAALCNGGRAAAGERPMLLMALDR